MKPLRWIVLALLLCFPLCQVPAPAGAQEAAFIPTQATDPYFFPLTSGGKDYPGQWHLWNQAPLSAVNAGQDAGLKNAWNLGNGKGYTGRGVVIGIVDDGVNGAHEDLKDNYRSDLSKNFSQNAELASSAQGPVQSSDNHGTAVAGVAAAKGGNSIGGTGAAPDAKIAGLRIRLDKSLEGDPTAAAQDYYDAYLWKSGLNSTTLAIEKKPEIHIKNHSYGPDEPFGGGTDRLKNILKATSENGVIHVFSAGNARNKATAKAEASCEDANKDFSNTSPYVIPVAALGSDGTYAYYSSYGANVFVAAPSSSYANYLGITTTDRTGEYVGYNRYDAAKNPDGDSRDSFPNYSYTSTFGGTSSSAPLVSGIMALGKEANPLMTVRMAKHALSLPSVTLKVDENNSEWMQNAAATPRNFNPNYGFGLIQAGTFVNKISDVAYVTKERTQTVNAGAVSLAIPDNDPAGVQVQTISINPSLPIESVEVGMKFSHARRGDLKAYLISPNGTESRLFNDTSVSIANAKYQDNEAVADFDWTFLTNAFWGEQKEGKWTLKLVDVAEKNTGTLLQYSFLFHMGKMELQKDEVVDLGDNNIEAESLTMSKYDNAAYKIRSGYTFSVRDGLRLLKGKLEVNGAFDLQGAQDSTIEGVLAGTGTFRKSGAGTLTLSSNASTFTGSTVISGGRIQIGSGGTLGGTLDVRAGGTLGGTGKVGSVANGGTVAPGNVTGTLTVQGTYSQSAAGGLTVGVSSATSNTLLAVAGAATLDGVLKTTWQGSGVPKPNTRFGSFLTSDTSVTGRFSSLDTRISPTMRFLPQYNEANKVYLTTERDYANASLQAALNANQTAVGHMLNSLANSATGDLDAVLSKIDALPTSAQTAAAFEALTPIRSAVHTAMATNVASFQVDSATGRLDDLRMGAVGYNVYGLEAADGELNRRNDRTPILLASLSDDLRGMIPESIDPRWGVFARGNISRGDQRETSQQKGYDVRNAGVTIGTDYRFSDAFAAGAFFGINSAKATVNDGGSTVKAEGCTAGLYGTLYGRSLYADGQLSYGWTRYDNERRIIFADTDRTARSKPSGNQMSAYGGTGYDIALGNGWVAGPTASLRYLHLNVDDYAESGAGALNLLVDRKRTESLQSGVGGKISRRWNLDGLALFSRLWGAWRHELADTQQTTVASLIQTNSAFSVSYPTAGRDLFAAGVDFSLQCRSGMLLYANYDILLSQNNFQAHNIAAGVRISF